MRERSSRPGRLYAAIPNEAMRDNEISMEARGLLALLMTYSDEWVFRKDHLLETTKWGRDKFERHMGELIAAGYVERVQTREEGTGKLLGSSWIIRDDRSPENQGVGITDALKNRPTVKPTHGESAPIRKNNQEEEQKGRNHKGDFDSEPSLFPSIDQPESKASTSEAFEELWNKYPKEGRKDKPAAKKKFAAVVKSGVDAARIISAAETYARWLKSGAPGEFRPQAKHLTTWLNKGSYEDEIDAPPPSQAPAARWYEDQIER